MRYELLHEVTPEVSSPAPSSAEVGLYEAIWCGELDGYSELALRESLKEARTLLAGLRARTIRPSAVVGTRYKRHVVRRVAEGYLLARITTDEAAIASRGRSHYLNQGNVRFYTARAERSGESAGDCSQMKGVRAL
ncbi:hypothetical protein ACFXKF_32850 [Streptomyces scopuliridis]|uniref:hypothetical protein n=1 Tax=Streptomyces scopuliridis TaxID=452529 RepID=UPI0036751B54